MLSKNKVKIICTIGPASRHPEKLEQLMMAGMNIARLNFSHGSFETHRKDVHHIRSVAKKLAKPIAIMADLPGPKIRIGDLVEESIELTTGHSLILTSEDLPGNREKISVTLPNLSEIVEKDSLIFINDGFIQLRVTEIMGREVHCTVTVGGPLSSRKGLNLPNVELGIGAFTEQDREIAKFALEIGVDAISQSFVESSKDILQLRDMANRLGFTPFIIAKIERARAVRNLDSILQVTDGIMVARGDLGVEIPICKIPVVQKEIVGKAKKAGKPVITATHMLESMISNRLPTRAEATDVANAILDGTDCVMLSGESAVGKYPVEAVATLCEIAHEVENTYTLCACRELERDKQDNVKTPRELLASSVRQAIEHTTPAAVIVPTRSGATARNISSYRLKAWILGVSSHKLTSQNLIFSYGIIPIHEPNHPPRWQQWFNTYQQKYDFQGDRLILTEGPSSTYPDRNHRMEIIDLTGK